LSPTIHNAAFAALGTPWVYVPLPVPPGEVGPALEGLRALGFAGANVTMPHKTEVAARLEVLSDDARRLRAVNTIIVGPEGLEGHNTDAPGFDRFLRRDAAFDASGRSAVVFGAGGAARACALALARAGLGSLTVAVRDEARGRPVGETLAEFDVPVRVVSLADAEGLEVDLVVNATPLGASGGSVPLPRLGPDVTVVDLLYHPATTPLLVAARAAGASAFGGLGLLLEQAGLSFELWTGQAAPLEVMSAAAVSALSDPGRAGGGPSVPA
jgi:shikimate dehydrogenase